MKFIFDIKKEDLFKCGIYKITNNVNGKIYIGSTCNFKKRGYEHNYCMQKGEHNHKIINLINNYPDIIFTMSILKITPKYKELEYDYIKLYDSAKNGLNVVEDPEEFFKYKKLKEKLKIKFLHPIKMKAELIGQYRKDGKHGKYSKKSESSDKIHKFIIKLGKMHLRRQRKSSRIC